MSEIKTETLDIVKFEPAVEEMTKIAESARAIVVTDFNDKKQIDAVTETRKGLKDWRLKIKSHGEKLRENAIKFQRDVIAKEKELLGIIAPEEERLLEIEEKIKLEKEAAKMKLLLPARRQRIEALGYKDPIADEKLNGMDIAAFESFFVGLQSEVNSRESKRLAEEGAKMEEEKRKQRIEDERREHQRLESEKAAKAAGEKIEREAKEKADKIIADAKAATEEADRKKREVEQKELDAKRAEIERKEGAEREAKAEEARKKAAADEEKAKKQFTDWYTDIIKHEPAAIYHTENEADGTITVWQKVGTYNPKAK